MSKTNKIWAIALIALWSVGTAVVIGTSFADNTWTVTQSWVTNPVVTNASTIDSTGTVGTDTWTDSSTEVADKNDNEENATLPANAIAQDVAATTALNSKKDVTITNTSVSDEHWAIVYEFTFSDGSEVNVDAVTWKVVAQKDHHGEGGYHGYHDDDHEDWETND